MQTLIIAIGAGLVIIGGYFVVRKALDVDQWEDFVARLWAIAGNSRTIAVAYAAEVVAALDEARLLDFSTLIGAERAGRMLAIMGVVMFALRLVTRSAISFRRQP